MLTGLQSDDYGFGQTGVLLAGLLNLPHATIIMQIDVRDGTVENEARNWKRDGFFPVDRVPAAPRCFRSSPGATRYGTRP